MPIVEFKPFSNLRNCFRCGKEFESPGSNRICSDCADRPKATSINKSLSFREKQVVTLVCRAKANKQIAFELHLTEGTIKEYLNRIFRKIGVSNRTELAVWAISQDKPITLEDCVA